ncbi:trichohyalin-like protein 1 [Psammomys obesus]|uniref:trichohyalin-like protein 1 n=1 Tax=Psammomys obesus TaxID=48139 RepID=UPI0024532B3F|nr:trichohyalin-like protein 1 [Psammomys obesus]
MSRLLRGLFCVIETFHKYASEDGDNKARLTRRGLRRLLEGEIGDFLQPHVFNSVERKLNLLNIDRDGTISFEDFLLVIFSLSNLFYFDIPLLHSEPRLMSKSEKMDTMDFQAITGTKVRLILPSEMAPSVQPSNEEVEADGHAKVSPQEDVKTHKLPRELSEPSDPVNKQPEDDQKAEQKVPTTEYDGVQFKRNTPVEVSKQSSGPTQEVPRERGKTARRQSDTMVRDHVAQRPSEDEGCASTAHDSFPRKEDKAESEPVEVATGKPSQTQESFEPKDDARRSETREPGKDARKISPETTNLEEPKADSRTAETHALPAQEGKHETQGQSIQSGNRNASETSSRGKWEEGQKEHERKTGPPAPETQTQNEKCQENGAEKGSDAQDPSSEDGNQNLPATKKESISGKEARPNEKDTADAFVINRNSPAAEETLETRERSQDQAPLENQSQAKSHRAPRTHDKAVKKEDHNEGEDLELLVTQSDVGSCETPNSLAPEVGKSSSETGEPQVTGDSHSRVDSHGESKHGSHNNNPDTQKQGAPDERSRAREEVELSTQEDRQLPEEKEQTTRENHGGLSSRTERGPEASVEPSEGGEVLEATAGSENRKSLKAEYTGAQ